MNSKKLIKAVGVVTVIDIVFWGTIFIYNRFISDHVYGLILAYIGLDAARRYITVSSDAVLYEVGIAVSMVFLIIVLGMLAATTAWLEGKKPN